MFRRFLLISAIACAATAVSGDARAQQTNAMGEGLCGYCENVYMYDLNIWAHSFDALIGTSNTNACAYGPWADGGCHTARYSGPCSDAHNYCDWNDQLLTLSAAIADPDPTHLTKLLATSKRITKGEDGYRVISCDEREVAIVAANGETRVVLNPIAVGEL